MEKLPKALVSSKFWFNVFADGCFYVKGGKVRCRVPRCSRCGDGASLSFELLSACVTEIALVKRKERGEQCICAS